MVVVRASDCSVSSRRVDRRYLVVASMFSIMAYITNVQSCKHETSVEWTFRRIQSQLFSSGSNKLLSDVCKRGRK